MNNVQTTSKMDGIHLKGNQYILGFQICSVAALTIQIKYSFPVCVCEEPFVEMYSFRQLHSSVSLWVNSVRLDYEGIT